MCHAIVEVQYRTDTTDDSSTLLRAKNETHLAELVSQSMANDHIKTVCVYRPDARWDLLEHWVLRE